MTKKLNNREWITKYEPHLQNKGIIDAINLPNLKVTPLQSWSFLKLAVLWSFAYYTYAPIAGNYFENICYVDLFSGSGLCTYKYDKKEHLFLGSPILMSTLESKNNFKNCYFFEKFNYNSLNKRLDILMEKDLVTCDKIFLYPEDCNSTVDALLSKLRRLEDAHFLLFVDPFSTEIDWSTMEKFLTLEHPKFDMIFNFLPFGVNRQTKYHEKMCKFYGDESYKTCLEKSKNRRLQSLEDQYIKNLKRYPNNVKTVHKIRIKSGKSFFYDLLYTTRKENPKWIKGLEHLQKTVERLSGNEVSVILDPKASTLDDFLKV